MQNFKVQQMNYLANLVEIIYKKNKINEAILSEAEVISGFMPNYRNFLFNKGNNEIIDNLLMLQDQIMLSELQNLPYSVKISHRVLLALKLRIKNYKSNFHLVLSPYLTNLNGIKAAYRTCDLIWQYAGDISIDFNHYSKRIILFNIYLSAITYYIQDRSVNFINTDKYIEEAIESTKVFNYVKKIIPKIENVPILRLFI